MRQINFLRDSYNVTVCCYDSLPSNDYKIIILPPRPLTLIKKSLSAALLLIRQYSWAHKILHPYKKFLQQKFAGEAFYLIIANDVETLPLRPEDCSPKLSHTRPAPR